MYKHEYKVNTYDALHKDSISLSFIDEPPTDALIKLCFSEEELLALEQSKIDLDAETKPMTDDEICEVFRKTPVNLAAMDNKQIPTFFDAAGIARILEDLGISCALPGDKPAPQLLGKVVKMPNVNKPGEVKQGHIDLPPLDDDDDDDAAPFDIVEEDNESTQMTLFENLPFKTKETEPEQVDPDDATPEQLGWKDANEMLVVIDTFAPKGAANKVQFSRWKNVDTSKAGFERLFPGELAMLGIGNKKAVKRTTKKIGEVPTKTTTEKSEGKSKRRW